jgi:hypothetical protein
MTRLIGFAAACLFLGCATSQRAGGAGAEPLRGQNCFALTLGPWSWPVPFGPPQLYQPPDTFQLLSPWEGHPGHYVRPDLPGLGTRWKRISHDSIEIYWSTGFAGVRLLLTGSGDTLSGTAIPFWDVAASEPTATATAIRIRCPTAATPQAR